LGTFITECANERSLKISQYLINLRKSVACLQWRRQDLV